MAKYSVIFNGEVRTIRVSDGSEWHNVSRRDASRAVMVEFWLDSTTTEQIDAWTARIDSPDAPRRLRGHWANLHDKEGKSHVHYVLWSDNEFKETEVVSYLSKTGCPLSNLSFSMWSDIRSAVRYLRHQDDPAKYQYPAISEQWSTDNGSRWFDGSVKRDAVARRAADSDRQTVGLVTLCHFIDEKRIGCWYALICALRDDAALLRVARENSFITHQLLKERRNINEAEIIEKRVPPLPESHEVQDIFAGALRTAPKSPGVRMSDGSIVSFNDGESVPVYH